MVTKHFLKTLIIFSGMILLGLLGVFLVSYFEKDGIQANEAGIDCQANGTC